MHKPFYSRPLFIIALAAVVAIAGTVFWLKAVYLFEATDNAYLKAHMSLISPKQSGYVREVRFEDNHKVMPGDVLVMIDDRDFRAHVAQAEAQVQVEMAAIRTLETEKQAQKSMIRQQQAFISAAQAGIEKSARDLRRFDNLAGEGAISEQARDAGVWALKNAKAEWEKYVSAKAEAESRLVSLDARIGERAAQLKAAQAALELARIDLDNTIIKAPIEGIIGNRNVQVGQFVQPGTVLAYLIPANNLFVEANFKETQLAAIKIGQPVEIEVDAVPDSSFKGVVDSFAPASGSEFSLLPPENATGNFTKIVRRVPVKISFRPETDLRILKPGLSATVKVKVR